MNGPEEIYPIFNHLVDLEKGWDSYFALGRLMHMRTTWFTAWTKRDSPDDTITEEMAHET